MLVLRQCHKFQSSPYIFCWPSQRFFSVIPPDYVCFPAASHLVNVLFGCVKMFNKCCCVQRRIMRLQITWRINFSFKSFWIVLNKQGRECSKYMERDEETWQHNQRLARRSAWFTMLGNVKLFYCSIEMMIVYFKSNLMNCSDSLGTKGNLIYLWRSYFYDSFGLSCSSIFQHHLFEAADSK